MGYSWGADQPAPAATWAKITHWEPGDRIPLPAWSRACCSNPTPVLRDGAPGESMIKCSNCGETDHHG